MEENVIERLSKWAKGEKVGPHRVLLYPTNKCNLRCIFCYQQLKPYDYSDILSKKKWLSVTKELCKMGIHTFQISGGGEPLIRNDIVLAMMYIIKSYKKEGRFVTNGTLWTKDQIKETIKLKWDHVIFSVDGASDITHDYLRGKKGAFNKTIKNIKLFTNYKKKLKKEKPLLEFSTVLTNKNYNEVAGIIKLAHKLDVKVITFEPVFVSNPFVHKLKMNKKQRKNLVKEISLLQKLAKSLNIITNLDTLYSLKTIEMTGKLKNTILKTIKKEDRKVKSFLNLPCYEPWIWPKIEANGVVGPCSTNSLNVNIKNKTFKQVWYGEEFNRFRERIKKRNLPEGCENCVSTHLPINKEIRKRLIENLKIDHSNK